MTANGILQIVLYLIVLVALVKPLGSYMARVYQGEPCGLDRILGPLERLIYRMFGIRPEDEMSWKAYAGAAILFKLAFFFLLYMILRLQGMLPLNPQGFPGVAPDLAFNTAVSFITNTNWQAYGGESTMSYLTQMMGLGVQNFVSAAQGMAVLSCPHPGIYAADSKHNRQFLGRSDTFYTLYPAAPFSYNGRAACIAGSGAELQSL